MLRIKQVNVSKELFLRIIDLQKWLNTISYKPIKKKEI